MIFRKKMKFSAEEQQNCTKKVVRSECSSLISIKQELNTKINRPLSTEFDSTPFKKLEKQEITYHKEFN